MIRPLFGARGAIAGRPFEVSPPALAIPSTALAFDVVALLLCMLVVLLIASTPLGSGDYGQWLMVSRYYSGQDIPDYRQIAALPPLIPLVIAGAHQVFGDPLDALLFVKILLAVSLFLATYWTGTGIFSDRSAGLLGATISFFVTDRLLEPFAFGGLLQLGALIFLTLAVGAYARGASRHGLAMGWWVLGGACLFLAALCHAGTGVIAILAGGSVAVTAAALNQTLSWRDRLLALGPTAIFLALLAPYWLLVILPSNTEYLVNTASLYYRGPEALWRRLAAYDLTLVVLYAGVLTLLVRTAFQVSRRRFEPDVLLGAWALAIFAFLLFTILRGVGTEYPRFMYPMLQPVAMAAGGAVFFVLRYITKRWSLSEMNAAVLGLGVVALLLFVAGPSTAESYRREATAYRMPGLSDMLASIEQTDAQLAEGQSVLSTVSVGKWVEGTTGREALFYMPNRYIFREVERERALAADVLLRSTLGVASGHLFLRYTEFEDGQPSHPWIAINHRGEYLDLMQVSPFETIISGPGIAPTRLSELPLVDFTTYSDDSALGTITTFSGLIDGIPVTIHQQANLSRDHASLILDYALNAQIALDLEILVSPIGGQQPVALDSTDEATYVRFVERAGANPQVEIRPLSQSTLEVASADEGNIIVHSSGASHASFEVSFDSWTKPFDLTGVYWPRALIEQYDVGAVYLPADTSLDMRMDRMRALGFEFAEQRGQYVLMLRGMERQP